jgi:hypothetical protein
VFCAVHRIRQQGQKRPREEIRGDRSTGELVYDVRLWDERARFRVMRAALLGCNGEDYVLPVLDHARVVRLHGPGILITGSELIPRGRSSIKNIKVDRYPQTWWCIPTPRPVERSAPDPAAARAEARRLGELVGESMTGRSTRRGRFDPNSKLRSDT